MAYTLDIVVPIQWERSGWPDRSICRLLGFNRYYRVLLSGWSVPTIAAARTYVATHAEMWRSRIEDGEKSVEIWLHDEDGAPAHWFELSGEWGSKATEVGRADLLHMFEGISVRPVDVIDAQQVAEE